MNLKIEYSLRSGYSIEKKLLESKNLLRNAMDEEVDLTSRKEGEDNLTEVQVTARRNRERRIS